MPPMEREIYNIAQDKYFDGISLIDQFEKYIDYLDFNLKVEENLFKLEDRQGGNLGDIESERFESLGEVLGRLDGYTDDAFNYCELDNLSAYERDYHVGLYYVLANINSCHYELDEVDTEKYMFIKQNYQFMKDFQKWKEKWDSENGYEDENILSLDFKEIHIDSDYIYKNVDWLNSGVISNKYIDLYPNKLEVETYLNIYNCELKYSYFNGEEMVEYKETIDREDVLNMNIFDLDIMKVNRYSKYLDEIIDNNGLNKKEADALEELKKLNKKYNGEVNPISFAITVLETKRETFMKKVDTDIDKADEER